MNCIVCSKIEHMKNSEDQFEVLRKIQKRPDASQRELAKDLGFSLGKLNYCLKALKNKGYLIAANLNGNAIAAEKFRDETNIPTCK